MRRRTRAACAGWAGFAGCAGLLTCLAGCAAARPRTADEALRVVTPDLERAEQTITAQELTGVVRFLADDALEGCGPGTRGDRLARAYVASLGFAIGLALANSGARPEWLPGDEFREVRERSLAALGDGAP